jgi:hypothetical protein
VRAAREGVTSRQPDVLHVVQRLNWVNGGQFILRLPGSTRLQSFPDADSAERARAALEEKARAAVNPFHRRVKEELNHEQHE